MDAVATNTVGETGPPLYAFGTKKIFVYICAVDDEGGGGGPQGLNGDEEERDERDERGDRNAHILTIVNAKAGRVQRPYMITELKN